MKNKFLSFRQRDNRDSLGYHLTFVEAPIYRRGMIDLVNYIRHNPDDFPEWVNSATAKLFSPPIFENDLMANGYWF